VDEIGEGLLAVDEDDRNTFAIPPFELCVVGDVDVLKLEREIGPDLGEHPSCAFAQVTAVCVKERDPVARGRGHA